MTNGVRERKWGKIHQSYLAKHLPNRKVPANWANLLLRSQNKSPHPCKKRIQK